MIEPRPLSVDELKALDGATVEVLGAGMDAFAFRTADGMAVMATLCLGCGGHVGYYEIDASIVDPSAGDLASS